MSYAVYRVDGNPDRCDLSDARSLVATLRHVDARRQTWTDPEAATVRGRRVTYLLTAVDRLGNESAPKRAR